MIWVNNILDLSYYHPQAEVPCYCEKLVFPYDLVLQGQFNPNSGAYSLIIDVLSADGLTFYETATTYFEYYFFVNPITGQYAFNIRLKSFSPAMCLYKCFILHVRAFQGTTGVFDKYTERYCQTTCCDVARDIDITQDGVALSGNDTTTTATTLKVTECGDPIIKLTTEFACFDKFTGDVYGIPTDVLSGSATFSFYKFTNIVGRIVPRPRTLVRDYSYNCRLQEVSTKQVYLLEGWEFFPAWKMNEIEAQLLANNIYVEDERYEYGGGTPMAQIHKCRELFKLNTQLEKCEIRQIFGCNAGCDADANYDGSQGMFILPENADGVYYYGENGDLIAGSYEDLLNYFRNLDGVTGVSDIDVTGLDCGVYKAFSVSGTGYIPTSFYWDLFTPQNRVFKKLLASFDDICDEYGDKCRRPVIDTLYITVEDQPCIAPVIDTMYITVEDITPTEVTIVGFGDWEIVDAETDLTVTENGFVNMNFTVTNPEYVEDPSSPLEPAFIFYQQIATVGDGAWPELPLTLTSTNSSMPEGDTLYIETNGKIFYQGYTTDITDTFATIEIHVTYYI